LYFSLRHSAAADDAIQFIVDTADEHGLNLFDPQTDELIVASKTTDERRG
jgi:hypothetical protein